MDRLNRLLEARDLLAQAIKACESNRDLAGLCREYRQILGEIDELKPREASSHGVDEITKRRAARAAGTKAQGHADSGG